MKAYKLTDKDGKTFNNCQWGVNVTHSTTRHKGSELCTNQVIHVYPDPYMAVFTNPVHPDPYMAVFTNPVHGDFDMGTMLLWECDCSKPVAHDALKMGVKKCTTLNIMPMPVITTAQRMEVAIRCVQLIFHDLAWNDWADKWLSGVDRTLESAESASHNTNTAANAVTNYAAYCAAESAAYAAYAANHASATCAAYAATIYTANAINAVAYAADINILDIIHEVVDKQ